MKFAVLIGWNGSVIKSFLRANKETGDEIRIAYSRMKPVDSSFIGFLERADAILIHNFSGDNLEGNTLDVIKSIIKDKRNVIAIDPILREFTTVSMSIERKVSEYYLNGGYENIKNMMLFIGNLIDHRAYEKPLKIPFSGIYDHGNKELPRRIGILFYRTAWIDRDTQIVDHIIDSLNQRMITAIAVFTNGVGDGTHNNMSAEECIHAYFMDEKGPVVDAVINLLSYSLINREDKITLIDLGVPVFQGLIYYYKDEREWMDSSGLDVVSSIISAMLPEIDGTIEPVIVGVIERKIVDEVVYRDLVPVKDQVKYLVNRIDRWLNLKYKKNAEKKIAIILHSGSSFRDMEANIGTATGLDTLNSVADIMHLLKENQYTMDYVPEDGEDLIKTIMNRRAIPEGKWTTVHDIIQRGGSVNAMPLQQYQKFLNEISENARKMILDRWGELNAERDYMLSEGMFRIPGIISGNLFIGIQPKRITFADNENSLRTIHDSHTPITHYWLAFYKWIQEIFKADAIIHVGTHGTLEFTPGKGLGLSPADFPQISIGEIPHMYLYSTNVPGEGIIAKRRSYAVLLDHITPPTAYGDMPEDVKNLEDLIDDFEESEKSENISWESAILEKIKMVSDRIGLSIDFSDPHKATHEIEHRLNLFKDSIVTKGLYVYGRRIDKDDLKDYVIAATRFDDSLFKKLGKKETENRIMAYLEHGSMLPDLEKAIIKDLLLSPENERKNLLKALEGSYVESGPSGSLTRGRYDVLPSGRNFYAVDPFKIPSHSAWQVGVSLANKLIETEYRKNNTFPETLGFILWSTDAYRSDGELISQILYTMGVEPVWQEGTKKVKDVKPIPLNILNRPRIDVLVECSGIVRDNLFNIIELIDVAVKKVSELGEDESDNFIIKHHKEYGHLHRVFSSKPGSYGSGVNNAIESSRWETDSDLADVFTEWMDYSYGKGNSGLESRKDLISLSRNVSTIVHKREIDEIDINDDSCNYSYAGGFYLMVRKAGSNASLMFEDTTNPNKPQVRTMKEEIERTAIGKLLNQTWINAQKKSGYRGGTEMLKKIEHLYGWGATTKMVNDRIFSNIAEKFALDKEMKEWFRKENPWALSEITARMIEAYQRGIWNASEKMRMELEHEYMEIEGENE